MYSVHQAGAAPSASGSDLLFAFGMVALLIGLVVIALRTQRAEHRVLRSCPVCAAAAIRAAVGEELAGDLVRLGLQCGQCGTWRRAVATSSEIAAHERVLKRDRRLIGDEALRLIRSRLRRDLAAFARELRREVVGADDFLARARTTLPRGRERR